jgi:4-hydroxybenzoate polyprenyltransferase
MRAAGCAYNDIVDRDIDAKVARTALPADPVGPDQRQTGLGLRHRLLPGQLADPADPERVAIGLGVASLALVAAYPFMKRITWWPQAWLGLTFNWGALMGFAAAAGAPGWPAILLYAGLVFWTLGYDTIYAVQDLEDDALAGVKSSALRLGDQAPRAVLAFYHRQLLSGADGRLDPRRAWTAVPAAGRAVRAAPVAAGGEARRRRPGRRPCAVQVKHMGRG